MIEENCEVLVVGAGPVGLVAGIDLARRGIDVMVVDKRTSFDPLTVRCNHISSRSMEIFRRLGFADQVRSGGFLDDFPHDVSIRLTTTGQEMGRITIPGRQARLDGKEGPDTWWPTVEPPHRMNQIFLEPILQEVADRTVGLRLHFDREVVDLKEQNEAVSVSITSSGGTRRQISCQYLIGCDGGASLTRKLIGARFEGDAVVQRVQSSFIRAPGLTERMLAEPCWAVLNINPRRSGTVYTIDHDDRFLVHNYLRPDEEFETLDRDRNLRIILGVDGDFEYDLLRKEDWIGRRLVTNKMAEDRIFLAGDAAHIWVPMGGYGMNAGIADATGLTWLLDARLRGWGGPTMLDAYAAERLAITRQVSHFAMETAEVMIRNRAAVPADIEEMTPAGQAAREWYGEQTRELNTPQYCCAGLNYGYYYDKSPIIIYDGEAHPPYSMDQYTPSTVPGCRMAHITMADGSSLYDHFGDGYTLVRTKPDSGLDLMGTADALDIPLAVVDVPHSGLHEHALYLVRPDHHVAWRSQREPDDPASVMEKVTGRG